MTPRSPAPGSSTAPPWRRRSRNEFLGLPWFDLAVGPDPARGEKRGHARGVIAIGDIATGVFACGGIARGLFAFGGVATGVFAFGGLAVGLAGAVGGLALALGLALGGGALGTVAVGGAAAGIHAIGGSARGTHVVDGQRTDPATIALFERFGVPLPVRPARSR